MAKVQRIDRGADNSVFFVYWGREEAELSGLQKGDEVDISAEPGRITVVKR